MYSDNVIGGMASSIYESQAPIDQLKHRMDSIKVNKATTIMEGIFREVMELMPQVIRALADGKITPEEYQELSAYIIDSVVDLTGKDMAIEDAKALVQGIVGLLKAYGLIKTS